MRITAVEIANYRGFAGDSFRLNLEQGENLLVYGENGAGKSSLYNTLKDFLHAATNRYVNIEQRRNRDNPTGPPAIRITTTANPTAVSEWTAAARGQDSNEWRNLDDGKGFLDYRALLKFYNASQANARIDLFPLLVEGMLAQHRMAVPRNPTFLSEWRSMVALSNSRLGYSERNELRDRARRFNAAFQAAASGLATRATELLREFDPSLGVAFAREQDADFTWYPKKLVPPKFVAEATFPQEPTKPPITDYHELFNEARLSAMAICLFFAALETCPIAGARLLVLDDVLIGLDMANRRRVINLVQRLFSNWQIIILTYHKAWFEVLKARVRVGDWAGNIWRSVVLRPERVRASGLIAISFEESGSALELADLCIQRRDHRAAAVYARTALEAILKTTSERFGLDIKFKNDRHKLTTEDFLSPLEKRIECLRDASEKLQGTSLIAELRFVRRTVLNAFAHSDELTEDEISGEVEHGIAIVRQFEVFLVGLSADDFASATNHDEAPIAAQLSIASQFANDGSIKTALDLLLAVSKNIVARRCEIKGISLRFRRHYPHSELYGVAFPKTDLSVRGEAMLRFVSPYLLGAVSPADFEPARFAAAVRFLSQVHLLDSLPLFAAAAVRPAG